MPALRTAFAVVFGAACGAGTPATEVEAPRPSTKVVHVALEYVVLDPAAEPPTSRVSLILTDETGAARREIIDEVPGGCSDVSPRARTEPLSPILGLDCWHAGAGVKLRFVHRNGVINVLRAEVDQATGGESGFDALRSIPIPTGTAVKTDYDESGPPGGPSSA